jgi:hypothetical protein
MRPRTKVTGRTKTEVRDKLKAAHAELDRGLRTSATYTVRQAVDDWLEGGLPDRSERTRSIYQEALKPLLEHVGARPLREGDHALLLLRFSGAVRSRGTTKRVSRADPGAS